MRQISLAIIALLATGGCTQQSSNTYDSSSQSPRSSSSVLGSLRPKANPAVVKQIEEEEAAAQQKAAVMEKQAEAQQQREQSDPSKRNLPDVSFAPMAPPADQVVQQSKNTGALPFWPFNQQQDQSSQPQPASHAAPVASYGGGYGGSVPPPPPEASSSSGLVPPPPAVSLSTQAQTVPYGVNPQDPYGSMYGNPYGQAPQIASQAPQQHAPGSLFSSGSRQSADNSDEASEAPKRKADFTPITPTGMEPRSAAKQKDDLKTLLKGAVSVSPLNDLAAHDGKVAAQLAKLEVGQPAESSKGVFNVSPRQMDTLFKANDLDKHISAPVKKIQTDIAQAYYRYLYAYNKFALAQQTIAARKQEADVAESNSEQQRAATDLAQAQNDADQAKDDMRSAQTELASVAGAGAARTVISHVSGVAPNMEALNAAENASKSLEAQALSKGGGFFHPMSSFFGGSKTDKSDKQDSPTASTGKADKKSKKLAASDGDLAPSPDKPASAPTNNQASAHHGSDPIAFQLKTVNVTARKSVLKVAVRNNTSAAFTFDPDVISISEGTHKLSDATVRADFDSTLVQPNQEVTGTITIFGHPWSDRLSVGLTDGTRTVQLKH
jgi:hypothetical protein